MKKLILFCFILLTSQQMLWAKEFPVKIKPVQKITTSNVDLREGNSLDFVVSEDVLINSNIYLPKGQKVNGTVTSIEENNFLVQPAKLYAENFRTTSINNKQVKLKGLVYKSGNEHQFFGEFVLAQIVQMFIRGGEVQIKPKKDEFTLYVEENL